MTGGKVEVYGAHKEIPWMVARHTFLGSMNGYVLLPPEHPWLDEAIAEKEVDIHGGITYHEDGWIGFDTSHAGDYWEESSWSIPRLGERILWTPELVVKETKRLADQVVARYNKSMKSKRQDA